MAIPPSCPPARAALLGAALFLLPLLTACGENDDGAASAATGAATRPPAAAFAGGLAPAASSGPLPVASPGPLGSPAPGTPRTVGELADRVAAAWASVRSYRIVSSDGLPAVATPALVSPAASPGAGPGGFVVTEEVVLPDRRHQTIVDGGVVSAEFLAVGGRIFLRGGFAQAVMPGLAPDAWIELDPVQIDPASRIYLPVQGLLQPIRAPYANLSEDVRMRDLSPLGPVTVEGRTCDAYAVVNTTQTGERIDVTVAIGPDGLPCLEETRAGGIVNRTVYGAYNEPFAIDIPTNVVNVQGTPVA